MRTTIAVLVLLSACATSRAPDSTMDSTPLRDIIVTDTPATRPAVERVVETTTTTTTLPFVVSPLDLPPLVMLTTAQVHRIIDDNDPPDWEPWPIENVRQGNIDLLSDVCNGIGTYHLDVVKLNLAAWLVAQLITMESTDPGFETDGIVDDLATLGCPTPPDADR